MRRVLRFALCLVAMMPLRTAIAADERLVQAAAQADVQLVRQLLAGRADVNAAAATAPPRCTGRCGPTIPRRPTR